MRHLNKSKIIAISLFSGLILALSANPAKAGDLSIGIGFNLGHPGYYNSYYPDSYVIHYRDYDRHRHHYYGHKDYYGHKHWKHHKKHWKHDRHHDRHHSYRSHGGRHADYRDYRRHDRYDRHDRHDGYRSYRH